MHDQADELRQLVLRTAAAARVPEAPSPPLVVVYGGKGGVGTTTIAVNLAIALAKQGHRVVLGDADFQQPDATALCGIDETDTVADVLAGRHTLHEVLQPGPGGIQVLPGAWAPDRMTNCTPQSQERLLAELGRMGPHADVVVLDAGSGPGPLAQQFWEAADLVVMVTTNDTAAIMDTYAAIKLLNNPVEPTEIHVLVNKAIDAASAEDVQARIEQACRRFLGLQIHRAPHVLYEPAIAIAFQAQRPFALSEPTSEPSQHLDRLADILVTTIQLREDQNRVSLARGAVA